MKIILLILLTFFINACKTTEKLFSFKESSPEKIVSEKLEFKKASKESSPEKVVSEKPEFKKARKEASPEKVVSEKPEFKKASKAKNSISRTCSDTMLNIIKKYVNKTSALCFMAYDTQKYRTAFKICKPLAENGDAFSQSIIASLYDEGIGGVKQNFNTAFKWYKKAAEQGMSLPQFKVGIMYLEGLGIRQDYKLAFKWHTLAAKQNFCFSQYTLGVMYYDGIGVPQSYEMAFKWYKQGAELGHSLAQINLGALYHDGKGVTKDYIKAHMWYNLASVQFDDQKSAYMGENKNNIARINISNLVGFMTSQEILEAQKLAEICYKNNFKSC